MSWREGNGESWKWGSGFSGGYKGHGSFSYRLPPGHYGTDEVGGVSMWHLLSLKILSDEIQYDFLKSASDEPTNVLLDDIRESMAVVGDEYRDRWFENARVYRNTRLSWRRLKEITAWKTPLEICKELGVPLILWPDESWYNLGLHPVIKAAQAESCRQSGWPVDEAWC